MLVNVYRVGEAVSGVLSTHRVWSTRTGLVRAALARVELPVVYRLVALTDRADRAAKGQSGEDAWELLLRLAAGLSAGRIVGEAA